MELSKVLTFVVTVIVSVIAFPTGNHQTPVGCGYESCPKGIPGKLNVHLIAHSHDDVGWLKTVDQYYFGSHPKIQKAGVQYILDSVIQALLHDPNKKFIYVETAFLWKWWMRQHDTMRHQVKKLVNNGQLEIIGGGWSMNDEAVTNYMSTIDQMTWGFRKLNDTFGECARPKIGWQIDPFGHSRDMASTFALLGFDGLFFGRLDYAEKSQRLSFKTAEMLWKGSPNLGKKSWLFTGILYNNYQPPPGFCFDLLCDDEPIVDDQHSPDYNVDERVSNFNYYVTQQAEYYATENIAVTMGGDFNYQDAQSWFTNLDKLIRYVNEKQSEGSRVNVFYSTPSCYLKALNEANNTWPTKEDDFFPYASDPHTYWTGYFTSRPTLKYYERLGNNFLQVCKQLHVLADLGPEDMVDVDSMREAMGIMQHHDAITGTEKQAVAFDYARILSNGFSECSAVASAAINKLMNSAKQQKTNEGEIQKSTHSDKSSHKDTPTVEMNSCLLTNISQCEISEGAGPFIVTIYNPLSRSVSQYVRLPVSGAAYSVKDHQGVDLAVQIVPIPQALLNIPGRRSQATNEIVFQAKDLPPLGFRSYYISRGNKVGLDLGHITLGKQRKSKSKKAMRLAKDNVVIGKGEVQVGLDSASGLMEWMQYKNVKVQVKQEFLYYEGMNGDNSVFNKRASGAYIFRPNGTLPKPITPSGSVISQVYKGELVDEVHQQFSDWVSQVIRVYKEDNHVEVNWLVGPIPVEDKIGKEVISRFTTEVASNRKFYTDSNGREMLQRVRKLGYEDISSYEDAQKLIAEPVAGNYYPITSRIQISGHGKTALMPLVFSVLTDRAQGGSSIHDGEIELMVHRRLLNDDAFGVGEALNEQAYGTGLVARGQHYVLAGPMAADNPVSPVFAMERELSERKLLAPWVFLSTTSQSFEDWSKDTKEFQGLKNALPPNVHVLTLEPWKSKSVLLRLEHMFEKNEDSNLSEPVTLNLQDLFGSFKLSIVRETTLGANQWLEDSKKLLWRAESNNLMEGNLGLEETTEQNNTGDVLDPTQVTLGPMDIRTFIIEFA